MPLLYGFSPLVVPPPSDWPPHVDATGYWVGGSTPDWEPSKHVTRFLGRGAPPVYVGFGSRPERDPRTLADTVLNAVRAAGHRVVLLTGWGGLQAKDSGDDVLIVDEIPHEWLFPRMAAVVHHGGAGTTGTALQSGVPSVVVPSFADQFFWGEQVERLGVGVNLPRKRLSVSSLAESIIATAEASMRDRAAELGSKLRAEHGVERAVEQFHALIEA
jgi:UDP:flavonoid glycosyltransferase YjiC (YdhE family)